MIRWKMALMTALTVLPLGCMKGARRTDPIRPVASGGAATGALPPAKPQLPPATAASDLPPTPTARATGDGSAPVVQLPGANAPTAAPPLLTPPASPDDALVLAGDERKPLRQRIQDRREERREREEPPANPSSEPAPVPAQPATKPQAGTDVREIYQRAAQRYQQLPDYQARFVRRELVGGSMSPTEEILFQFRKEPYSVYMRNLGNAGKGREVLYVHGKFDNNMHVVTGEGDNRLFGAGFKTSLKPDSPLASGKSRRKITEAGIGSTLMRMQKMFELGQVRALGQMTRQEYPYPLDGIEITFRPGDDPLLKSGGTQQVYFDPNPQSAGYGLPVLIMTQDTAGKEVEYYCFDQFRAPAGLTDADFHPERLGKK